ncbi:hypothetical protein ACOBR2_20850 [Telmatobacter bradus]|uniref:hypothetical protein n=1 Tax=Telmatobacter bradus TaxID=474953 RepID=UPI003B434942
MAAHQKTMPPLCFSRKELLPFALQAKTTSIGEPFEGDSDQGVFVKRYGFRHTAIAARGAGFRPWGCFRNPVRI